MNLDKALQIASGTDVGKVRKHNEDSLAVDAARGLVILADGMGGHNAGEIASGMATNLIKTEIGSALDEHHSFAIDPETGRSEAQDLLRDQITKANSSIYQISQSQSRYSGMGTTLVAALFYDNRVTVAHVGDSRLYRLRGDTLEQLTKDHSLIQEQLDIGVITREEAEHSTNQNLVMRALGVEEEVVPEMHDFDTQPGDLYLLCSDGLTDMVNDDDITGLLKAAGTDLDACAQSLVQRANDNGGRDNVSVVLIRVARDYAASRRFLSKLVARLS